jgi:Flp pilus assembly protein TadD
MKRVATIAVVVALAAAGSVELRAQATAIMGRVRGEVRDKEGRPVPDVAIEAVHASGKKLAMKTDKKGGFVRVGIAEGDYTLTFTKPGYKPARTKVWISLGGVSEIPPVTLEALPADVAAVPGAPGDPALPAVPAPVQLDAEALAAAQGLFAQALEAEKGGRGEEAELLYKEIVAKWPKLSEAHYNLGRIYRQRQDWAGAEAALRQSIALQPDRSDSYVALAGVLSSAGRKEDASQLLADAASRFAQDAAFQFALGVRHYNASETDAASAAFKRVRALDPANPEPIYYLGVIAVGKNQTAEAVSTLEAYLAMTGQDPKNVALAKGILQAIKTAPKK